MVTNVTSLTGNGLKDWLLQRASAVIVGFYFFFLGLFLLINPDVDYQSWHALFHHPFVAIATMITAAAISVHAWIGIWTVTTDYITCMYIRVSVQGLVAAWLLGQFFWILIMVWGK